MAGAALRHGPDLRCRGLALPDHRPGGPAARAHLGRAAGHAPAGNTVRHPLRDALVAVRQPVRPVRALLERAGVRPTAHYALVHAEHGFTTNLPLEDLDRPENLLALDH